MSTQSKTKLFSKKREDFSPKWQSETGLTLLKDYAVCQFLQQPRTRPSMSDNMGVVTTPCNRLYSITTPSLTTPTVWPRGGFFSACKGAEQWFEESTVELLAYLFHVVEI